MAGAGGAAGGGLGGRSHALPSLSGKSASRWGYELRFGWLFEEVRVWVGGGGLECPERDGVRGFSPPDHVAACPPFIRVYLR